MNSLNIFCEASDVATEPSESMNYCGDGTPRMWWIRGCGKKSVQRSTHAIKVWFHPIFDSIRSKLRAGATGSFQDVELSLFMSFAYIFGSCTRHFWFIILGSLLCFLNYLDLYNSRWRLFRRVRLYIFLTLPVLVSTELLNDDNGISSGYKVGCLWENHMLSLPADEQ